MYIREPDFELFLRLTSCQRQYYVFTTVVIYRLSVLIYVFLFIELYTCFFFSIHMKHHVWLNGSDFVVIILLSFLF